MIITQRINVTRDRSRNFIPVGQWDAAEVYKLSDMGIPVVEVPDSTALGFSVYALDTDVSTKGKKPSGSNSEWRLMESAEFIYMLQAYIKHLRATLITAEHIESLMIRTKNLEVLNGAKIGIWDIDSGSLRATSGNDEVLLSAPLIRFIRKATDEKSYVFIGGNSFPASLGGAAFGPIRIDVERTGTGLYHGALIGAHVSVKGQKKYDDVALSGNHAFYISKGTVTGFRHDVRRVNKSKTLSVMETAIYVVANNVTLSLPSDAEDGQLFWICPYGYSGTTIKVSDASHKIRIGANEVSSSGISGHGWHFLLFDAVNKRWSLSWMTSK